MATINTTKKQSAIETTIENGTITFEFSDGRTLRVYLYTLTPTIREAAVIHGLKQKLCDAAAISRDPATGRAATIDTKYEAVKEVFDRITSADGTWNKQREAGAGGSGGLLLAALARMYAGRKTKEDLVEFLSTKTEAEKAALRGNKTVAEIILSIKTERNLHNLREDGIDANAILDELED